MSDEIENAAEILVVDDLPEARESLQAILELVGYRVSVAQDGAEALELMKQRVFCAVITDMSMPIMDGAQLISEARRIRRFATLPMILISAAFTKTFPAVAADAFLNKPFSVDVLEALLVRLGCPAHPGHAG